MEKKHETIENVKLELINVNELLFKNENATQKFKN